MIKQTVKLVFFFAIFIHSSIGSVVTTKGYATLRKTQNIDPLLAKAEKGETLTPQQMLQVRNTILSLGKTSQKTAEDYKNMIKKSEILSSLFPDIIGKEKIIKSDGSEITSKDKQILTKKAEREVTNAIIVYENSGKTTEDKKIIKEKLIATQAVAVRISEATNNPLITQIIEQKIADNATIVDIVENQTIEVNEDRLAKDEKQVEGDLGIIFYGPDDILKDIRQELYVHAISQEASERFDAYQKLGELIENYLVSLGDEKQLDQIRTDFIARLIEDMQNEFKKFEKSGYGHPKHECHTLDLSIDIARRNENYIARLKESIEFKKTLASNYKKYIFPTVNNLLKVKNCFGSQETIKKIFGNLITDNQKKQIQNLVIVYVLGAENPTNLSYIHYNDISIGGLLDRYATYINDVFLAHKDVKDRQDLLAIIGKDGIIGILNTAYWDLFAEFLGTYRSSGETIDSFKLFSRFQGILREKVSRTEEAIRGYGK